MFKSRRKTKSVSNELTCGVDKCPVEKKSIPPDTRRSRRGESSLCASRKRRRNAEDSGYTSKLEGNKEEKSGDKAHKEDVAVVDLCCTSNSSYEASADSKQGSSSVEMVGEVRHLLSIPFLLYWFAKTQVFKPGACGFGDVNFGQPGH